MSDLIAPAATRAREAANVLALATRSAKDAALEAMAAALLAHATEPKGSIALDAGAVRALTERQASLLPAGITGVSGTFVDGDPVDLVGPDGRLVARGLVNYDASELPALMGRSTHDLAAELGASYEREVVHRDDLTLIDS